MPTVVVRHDLDIAGALSGTRADLSVISTESTDETETALAAAEMLVVNPTLWDDRFLPPLEAGDWVQATSAGYAAFPVAAFRERGVVFTNAAGNYGPPVSEHVFALALAHARRLPAFFDAQAEARWAREASRTATDWAGRQLTVYGLGDIGETVARRGLALDLEVVGVKRDPAAYDGCLPADRVITPSAMTDRLRETDLLAVTVPLTSETRHSIDAEVFAALPDDAFVANVARGPVVDQSALVEALEAGSIGGAGLDVFAEEPLPSDSPLWDLENAIVTPHVGGRSDRFVPRFADLFLENYDRRQRGEPLVNRID